MTHLDVSPGRGVCAVLRVYTLCIPGSVLAPLLVFSHLVAVRFFAALFNRSPPLLLRVAPPE